MATGSDFVTGALRKLGVRAGESAIEAFEMEDGIEVLNDLMSELEPIFNFGFKPIPDSNATVRVPRNTHDAIKAMLAGRLAPDYEKQISPELAVNIASAMNNIRHGLIKPGTIEYPDTLPVGSGNQDTEGYDDAFYPGADESEC